MKLIEKNNRLFFRFTLLLLVIGSLLFYWSVAYVFQEELDEQLLHDQARVIQQIRDDQTLIQFPPLLEVSPLNEPLLDNAVFKDTSLFDPIAAEEEPFRQLVLDTIIQGKAYQITVRNSLVESEDLLFAVGISTAVLCIVLFLGLYWLNRRQTLRLWQPFYDNLSAVKKFSLLQPASIQLLESDISEFQELKKVLEELTIQVQKDYSNLKEFTENASHEIQTPLAIIRSKVEELLVDSDFTKNQIDVIKDIYQSTNRLSRLNRKLLLLAKIEHRQFEDLGSVSFNNLVEKELLLLSDLIAKRNLKIKRDLASELSILMSETLAEILVINLLENAIRHSKTGDTILITTQSDKIIFANTGERPISDPEQLFERFHQRSKHENSMGLGLAIVKKVAMTHGFQVAYQFKDAMHQFFVYFSAPR